MSTTPRPIQSVSNQELYNRWAKVYDTDGNILQAIDDVLLPPLLSHLFTTLASTSSPPTTLTITELGAGTGRNTVKLLSTSLTTIPISRINALDLSLGMLDVARERCTKYVEVNAGNLAKVPGVHFYGFDAFTPSNFPDVKKEVEGNADVILSTLVLEHLPISTFFKAAKSLLKESGGCIVLTNMHAEMGRISQAGFVDGVTGDKIQGHSFVYEVQEVLEEGAIWGFVLEGAVGEREVRKEDIGEGKLLGARGKKWIGIKVWFGLVFRFKGESGDGGA